MNKKTGTIGEGLAIATMLALAVALITIVLATAVWFVRAVL